MGQAKVISMEEFRKAQSASRVEVNKISGSSLKVVGGELLTIEQYVIFLDRNVRILPELPAHNR